MKGLSPESLEAARGELEARVSRAGFGLGDSAESAHSDEAAIIKLIDKSSPKL